MQVPEVKMWSFLDYYIIKKKIVEHYDLNDVLGINRMFKIRDYFYFTLWYTKHTVLRAEQ